MESMGQLAVVLSVLGLLGGTLWWLRRRGFATPVMARGGPGVRRLETVARLPLGPQQTLHLVRFGDKAWLVAAGSGGCTLLESLPWRDSPTQHEALP
jgi:flagellar biosynthetic protein FliO